ncbi:MAG TPA: gamma-glutamyl-gamma-aminobutyrate hydrolase family protein [Myxococcales bacterium]|jgi:GMP synthase (glutamine-hydrolysing)
MTRRLLLIHAGPALPGVARRHGDFDRLFTHALEDLGAEWTIVRPFRGEALPNPTAFEAAFMTGSHASVRDRAPWMVDAERWLRDAVECRTPFLGVCFGHQLLAHAFGAQVVKNPRGLELGTREVELTAEGRSDPLFEGLEPELQVLESHEDEVTELPPRIRRLAGNAFTAVQAIAVGSARGVQFHPEFSPLLVRDLATELGLEPPAEQAPGVGAGLLRTFVERLGRGAS